jgi:L-lysine 2,3-aminomutase
MLFRDVIKENLSFAGKNDSVSSTPILFTGGDWISCIIEGMSRFFPSFHEYSMIEDIRICSRLSIGSASIPTNDKRLVTVLDIVSLRASLSCIISLGGTSNDFRIETGIPELLPGV